MSQTAEQRAERMEARWSEAIARVDAGEGPPWGPKLVEAIRAGERPLHILDRLGVKSSAVYGFLNDPHGEKARARKGTYTCPGCGREINADGGQVNPRLCRPCDTEKRNTEAKQRVIDAIREWDRRYGSPPSAVDWNRGPSTIRRFSPQRQREIAERMAEGDWPATNSVQRLFGSWNAAIEAAGFQPIRIGQHRNPEQWKNNLKGRNMKSAEAIIARELEKADARIDVLRGQIEEIEKRKAKLVAAKEAMKAA